MHINLSGSLGRDSDAKRLVSDETVCRSDEIERDEQGVGEALQDMMSNPGAGMAKYANNPTVMAAFAKIQEKMMGGMGGGVSSRKQPLPQLDSVGQVCDLCLRVGVLCADGGHARRRYGGRPATWPVRPVLICR